MALTVILVLKLLVELVEVSWIGLLIFLDMLVIFGFFSNFLELFHKFISFVIVSLFKKFIFDVIEFLAINFHSDFILIVVNFVINSFVNLILNSQWWNSVISLNDAFCNFFILNFLLGIYHTVWMILLDHGKVLSLDLGISQRIWIGPLRVTQDFIIFSWRKFLIELRAELWSTKKWFLLNIQRESLWQKRNSFLIFQEKWEL